MPENYPSTINTDDLRYLSPILPAGEFVPIDLTNVPDPQLIEELDYEAVRIAMIADFQQRWPDFDALVESDPVIKLIEVAAYRETLLRARVNHAARSVLVAYAQKNDLDQLAAMVNVTRAKYENEDGQLILEDDARLRLRILLAWEGLAATGTTWAYVWHVYNFSPRVANVSVYSPFPGVVRIVPLMDEGDGQPTRDFLRSLRRYIKRDDIKNLTDMIQVRPPRFINFEIRAELVLYPGAGQTVVHANAMEAIKYYLNTNYRVGRDINRSSIMAALHQSGVSNVRLAEPKYNIVVKKNQIARCENITVNASIYETQ